MNNNDDKFIIRAKKNYGETSVVSCRMPNGQRLVRFPCRHVHRRRRIRPRGQFPLRRQDLEPLGKLVRSPLHRRPPHRRLKQNILPCAGQAPAQVFLQLIPRISHGIMKQI